MNTGRRLQKAIDFIEANLQEKLTPDMVAREACMSAFYFQHLLSLLCGITLGEYIRNRRLTLAGMEIQSTNSKIIDIALKYGYQSPESFSRAFAHFHGVSPTMARTRGSAIQSLAKLSIQSIMKGMNLMEDKIKERGYAVGRVGSVYLTNGMDRTAKWFEEVLGWYAGVERRGEDDSPAYGCAMPFNGELIHLGVTAFNGIFLLPGDTPQCLIAMMEVSGISRLYEYVKKSGWDRVTSVAEQSWGARVCDVITIDGCTLRFFESL